MWVLLIKFMVGPTIYVKGGLRIYCSPGLLNNFPLYILLKYHFHMSLNSIRISFYKNSNIYIIH